MHPANIRHKLHLYGKQIALVIFILFSKNVLAQVQTQKGIVNPKYDDRKMITYGFTLGAHTTSYRHKYSELFTSARFDSLHSISPRPKGGFSLGFIVNFRLAQYLDARITPRVSFSEYVIEYQFVGGNSRSEFVESTNVGLPILFKYKSVRRDNSRMYFVGGITPMIEASGKSNAEEDLDLLQIKQFDLAVDFGFGFDLYYPLFKLSPEIRFAYGLINVLQPFENAVSAGIDKLTTKQLSLYFHFQ